MNQKFIHAIEEHPTLGWMGSLISLLLGWISWFVDHADDFAKAFGVAAAVFGAVAGYYTMRIQRRAWKRRTDK